MIHLKQKALAHIYKDAAGINDLVYRGILADNAGVKSCADRRMTQDGFDHVMAALEAVLFDRVARNEVKDPCGINPWIRTSDHWRRKLPQGGRMNSRQLFKLRRAWDMLGEFLETGQHTDAYLTGIVEHSVGRKINDWPDLSAAEAGFVIDALNDRITAAIKRARKEDPSVIPDLIGNPG
jgi:hypothetical protein